MIGNILHMIFGSLLFEDQETRHKTLHWLMGCLGSQILTTKCNQLYTHTHTHTQVTKQVFASIQEWECSWGSNGCLAFEKQWVQGHLWIPFQGGKLLWGWVLVSQWGQKRKSVQVQHFFVGLVHQQKLLICAEMGINCLMCRSWQRVRLLSWAPRSSW